MRVWWHRYVYREEADDGAGGTAAGGGGESTAQQPGDQQPGDATAQQPAAGAAGEQGEPAAGEPKSMLEAINRELDKKVESSPEEKEKQAQALEAKKKTDAAAARKALEEKAAAGDEAAKKELDATLAKEKAAAEAAKKPKDLAKMDLTPEEKKALGAKTAGRFTEVLQIAKTERARADAAEARLAPLDNAWKGMMGALKETSTTDEDLAQLLEYNRLTKTGKVADAEAALQIVTAQRASLLKLLGRPADGEDPLKGHADLLSDVEESKITRERALEIAESRRREAVTKAEGERTKRQQQQQGQQQRQREEAQETALTEIEKWCQGLMGTDIDYKAKDAKLQAEVAAVVKEYPPHLWLPTLKRLYAKITVDKKVLPKKEEQPLRGGSGKPGAPAPGSMEEAIDRGLGYQTGTG